MLLTSGSNASPGVCDCSLAACATSALHISATDRLVSRLSNMEGIANVISLLTRLALRTLATTVPTLLVDHSILSQEHIPLPLVEPLPSRQHESET